MPGQSQVYGPYGCGGGMPSQVMPAPGPTPAMNNYPGYYGPNMYNMSSY